MQRQDQNKSGVIWVAAGFTFLVVVALVLMGDKTAVPPEAATPAAAPATAPSVAMDAPAGQAAAPAAPVAQAPAEVRAALDNAKPAAGSLVSRVYFATGSAALDEDGRATIAKAARTLSAGLAARVALSGYVDASGSAAANAELAKQRAQAVRDALLAAGVSADAVELRKPQQITAGGGADEARRVEILLQR